MQTYEITIVNTDDKNELHTFTVTAEDLATLADNLEKTANYSDEISLEVEDGIYVVVTQNSEHGYNADLYEDKQAFDEADDAISGGLCTGTLKDAINMALNERN